MTTIPHVRLLIERDESTTLCVDVPAYEQALLEAPYPEGAVQELEHYDVEIEDFDVNAAFERLVEKYRGHAATDAARVRRFERARDLKAWIDEHQPAPKSRKGKVAHETEPA